MKIFTYSLFILKINILCGITRNDLCIKNSIDKSCSDSYPFKCHQKYCTKNKQICDDFNLLKKHLIMERHFRAIKKLNLMIKTIKKCVKNENKLKSTKGVCIKSENCFLKQKNLFSGTSYKFINNSKVCPCGNEHSFKCNGNNNYCGVNKQACDNALQNNNGLNKMKCGKFNIKFLFSKNYKIAFFFVRTSSFKNKKQ
jgi:hypothetical protein